MSKEINQKVKVIHQDGLLNEYSPSTFKEAMGVEYLAHLEFQPIHALYKLKRKIYRAEKKGETTIKQKWLGTYYSSEIQADRHPDVTIQWINDAIGYGVITNTDLSKHAFIGEYTGIVRRRRFFGDKKNNYCFCYSSREQKDSGYLIDAQLKGNITRFINHSDQPNCEPIAVIDNGLLHIILIALKNIPKGTQLSYDYGEYYWKKRKHSLTIDP